MIWEVGGEIRRLPASIETPAGEGVEFPIVREKSVAICR